MDLSINALIVTKTTVWIFEVPLTARRALETTCKIDREQIKLF